MLARLLLLFILVPFIELWILLWISQYEGPLFTLGLIIVTGAVGAWLARMQGYKAWRDVQQQLAAGQIPSDALMDGLMILVAGALLVTPGVLTDLTGFALLTPFFRKWVKAYLAKRFQAQVTTRVWTEGPPPGAARPPDDEDVIDVEFEAKDER